MRSYEISPEERRDEDEQHDRDFGVESHRHEDERADWVREEREPWTYEA